MPVTFFCLPTMFVVAIFARADRRSPLVVSVASASAYLVWLTATNDLAKIAASDAQGALIYVFGPIYSLPIAVLGGGAAWVLDAALRHVLAVRSHAKPTPPYR